jgi:hypothetical protein
VGIESDTALEVVANRREARRTDAPAHIAYRRDIKRRSQLARRPTVICNRHNRSHLGVKLRSGFDNYRRAVTSPDRDKFHERSMSR